MVIISNQPQILAGEQRVAFYDVSWDNYLQIFKALPQHRRSRLCYESGILEFTMPLEDHELFLRLIERFIFTLVSELDMNIKTMGSTTMNREDIQQGAEPDCAYYIQNQPLVAGRKVNFAIDPPPDLVVEVDITHTDINKNLLYATISVPEFWHYNGRVLQIFYLENGYYQEINQSLTLPIFKKEDLYNFLAEAYQNEVGAERRLRAYIRDLVNQKNAQGYQQLN